MTLARRVDVCVVGAGPAGSVLATQLARLGRNVLLVERARFPRDRVGESLTPGVAPALRAIDASWVLDAAGAAAVRTVHRSWGASVTTRVDTRGDARVVDRALFDAALLEHARAHGVVVRQPACLLSSRSAGDGGVDLVIEHAGVQHSIHARALAFATGRSGSGARPRRLVDNGARTFALYAYWHGAVDAMPAIESVRNGWCWGVPIPERGYNALTFVDARELRLAASPEECYHEQLNHSSFKARLQAATRVSRVQVVEATPQRAAADTRTMASYPCIRVGDAALALDPLSSSGVQKAIQHAMSSAVVLHTMLESEAGAVLARRYFDEQLDRMALRHIVAVASQYAAVAADWPDAPFWTDRAGTQETQRANPVLTAAPADSLPHPDAPLRRVAGGRVEQVPCVGQEWVQLIDALLHPELDDPVAFVNGHAVAPLWSSIRDGASANDIVARWPLPQREGRDLLRWFLQRGLLQSLVPFARALPDTQRRVMA